MKLPTPNSLKKTPPKTVAKHDAQIPLDGTDPASPVAPEPGTPQAPAPQPPLGPATETEERPTEASNEARRAKGAQDFGGLFLGETKLWASVFFRKDLEVNILRGYFF